METVFWSRLKQLCEEQNTTPTGVCKAIGISTGSPPGWKRGRLPSRAIIEKFAEYFGVEPEYFVSAEKEAAPVREPQAISDEDLKFAMFGTTEITDELFAELKDYAEYLKLRKL